MVPHLDQQHCPPTAAAVLGKEARPRYFRRTNRCGAAARAADVRRMTRRHHFHRRNCCMTRCGAARATVVACHRRYRRHRRRRNWSWRERSDHLPAAAALGNRRGAAARVAGREARPRCFRRTDNMNRMNRRDAARGNHGRNRRCTNHCGAAALSAGVRRYRSARMNPATCLLLCTV